MLGLESSVTIGKQITGADPVTLARQSLQIYGISGGQTEGDTDDNILGGQLANQSDPVEPGPGLDDHKITVKVPLCIAQFPYWLAAFFGSEDDPVGGANPNYVHGWRSGAELPYIFLEHKLKSGRYRRHYGLVGESITIDLDAEREGYGMAELTFAGLHEDSDDTILPGAITAAPALDRTAQKKVAIAYNEVAGGDIMGGKFTFGRVLKRLRGADGTGVPYAVEIDNVSSLSGSLRCRFHDDTFNDDAVGKIERGLIIQLLRNANRGLDFTLGQMRLARTPVGVDGPGGLEQQFDFRAWQSAANPALTARALSSAATVAL